MIWPLVVVVGVLHLANDLVVGVLHLANRSGGYCSNTTMWGQPPNKDSFTRNVNSAEGEGMGWGLGWGLSPTSSDLFLAQRTRSKDGPKAWREPAAGAPRPLPCLPAYRQAPDSPTVEAQQAAGVPPPSRGGRGEASQSLGRVSPTPCWCAVDCRNSVCVLSRGALPQQDPKSG